MAPCTGHVIASTAHLLIVVVNLKASRVHRWVRRLTLKLPLNLFQVGFELLLCRLKVLLLLLDVGLFAMDDFLQTAHRVEELLAEIDERLAILPPESVEYLHGLHLHGWLIQLLD